MKNFLLAGLLATLALPAGADAVNIYGRINYWHSDAKGGLNAPAAPSIGFLGISMTLDKKTVKNESNSMLILAIEHPVPVLPNIRLAHSQINFSGQALAVYDTLSADIPGEIDLSHTDLTAYYRLPVPLLDLNLGLTGRFYDGHIQSQVANAQLQTEYLHIYLATRFDIPVTGLAIGADINAGDNGDERGVDIDAWLQYTSPIGLGVIAGYRSLDIDLESTARAAGSKVALLAEFEVTGPYLGISYRF